MAKATAVFIGISILLICGIGFVLWQLIQDSSISIPLAGGSSIALGLPQELSESPLSNEVQAEHAIVYMADTNTIGFQKNAFERQPLASITKLMTAMVALDHGINWGASANILPQEYVEGGELILAPGETVTMRDLFTASLLGSANNATLAYVRQLNISKEDFIREMNRKAVELHLEQTEFHDVTGLSPSNLSTAYEIAIMAHYAFTNYPEIAKTTSQKEYTFEVQGSGRMHTMRNTNKPVANGDLTVTGSKTGFLYEAGYCLVVEGTGAQAHRVAVVLNNPSEEAHFSDIIRLLKMQVK